MGTIRFEKTLRTSDVNEPEMGPACCGCGLSYDGNYECLLPFERPDKYCGATWFPSENCPMKGRPEGEMQIQIEISPAGSPTREELIESVRALALCGTFDAKGNPIVCAPNIGKWMQASILCKRFLGNPSSKTPQPADQKCSTSVLDRENPPDSGDA